MQEHEIGMEKDNHHDAKTHHTQMEEEYNNLKIPCDWNIAKRHALARRTAPDTKDDDLNQKPETCPCCGFEIERQIIGYWDHPNTLSFLGSGFPLFYNFMKFCILILCIQLCVKQFYNIQTNYEGTYCSEVKTIELENNKTATETNCQQSILLHLSLANKLNRKDLINKQQQLNLISLSIIMIVLVIFRRSQTLLDIQIDESQLTPSDYTICAKNIPKNLKVDYKKELTNLFQNYAVMDSELDIKVMKVVLVYDIEEIIKLENEINKLIKEKKQILAKNKFEINLIIIKFSFNLESNEMKEIDEKIENLEHKIHHTEQLYRDTNANFAGIAFISFYSEDMKDQVLQENKHTFLERLKSWLNKGQTPGLTEQDLSWENQKLFIEQAPEPNEVDWEFIHIPTGQKIISRIKAWMITISFEALTFLVIYIISLQLSKEIDRAYEQQLSGELNPWTSLNIIIICWIITLSIVLFNKFGVGKILHYIVDEEQIGNKTKFQISYARKYSVCLFLNAAIISYLIDIVIQNNIYGNGGFIYNESLIFILNALLPPFIWLIDPWSILKNYQRKKQMQLGDKAILTQQEANVLMEHPDYLSAKRYSDLMKTMWFTFLYGTAIPIGTICSCVGVIFYYFIDKYNILRRRTVKESISKELSVEMINLLDLIIFFSAFGEMTMSYAFYKEVSIYDLYLITISIVFILLPIETIINYLFPLENVEEPIAYDEGALDFDTDYDRENPVTKSKAIKEFNQMLEAREQEGHHKQHLHNFQQ